LVFLPGAQLVNAYNPHMAFSSRDEVLAWRASLDRSLRRPYGWLALAGLHWLDASPTTLGSSPGCDYVLPAPAPARAGTVTVESGQARLRVEDGVAARIDGEERTESILRPDTSGAPTTVDIGPLRMVLIRRMDLVGLRLWDSRRPGRLDFTGRSWFPFDESAQLLADWQPDGLGRAIAFPNELGQTIEEPIAGHVAFEYRGEAASLAALEEDDGSLRLIFADAGRGVETYAGGRYLLLPQPRGDTVEVDFNRAYNPPCAFTEYATCTLPPDENKLAFSIAAGERAPSPVNEKEQS
jgi:uncharacterized protein (DUF1684 family)